MTKWEERAYAKINLTLDVLGKREDGYHELKMVMQSVSLCDVVTLEKMQSEGMTLSSNLDFLPLDEHNIAAKAAKVFAAETGVCLDGLHIHLEKAIPVCAGTAGGSSDGAAVLRGLNRLYETGCSTEALMKMGEQIGSDVPYCVMGGTALAEGRGEVLTRLAPMPDCHIVMCKPGFPVSTPELYHKIDSVKIQCHPDNAGMIRALEQSDLTGICQRMYNVFEDVLPAPRRNTIREIRDVMLSCGAVGTCMSGTGPTTFGIFLSEESAKTCFNTLKAIHEETFLARPV